jgi:hypothetical protein
MHGPTLLLALTLAVSTAGLSVIAAPPATGTARQSLVDIPATTVRQVWPNRVPASCPLPRSSHYTGIEFTGRHREYTRADTWYPSWASDGNLYSPWTDGSIGNERCGSGSGAKARTGQARIVGGDPLDLKVVSLGTHAGSALPYGGRYPCGSLVHDGVWYHGSYCLDRRKGPWDVMGPFVGFRISGDYGRTWTPCPLSGHAPLFGESAKGSGKVKIGAPHFVDFGQNMEHSPDGKAYLVAHGAVRPGADVSWISGDQVYLVRARPTPEAINDVAQYEFFAGHNPNRSPCWTRNFSDIKPIVTWEDNAGCATMTWNDPLKKYLMCVTYGGKLGGGKDTDYDTTILESDAVTGPWKLVTYMKAFGPQAYFVNLPSKFISNDGKTLWLCYSANWSRQKQRGNPPGSRYALCLQEIRLLTPTDPAPAGRAESRTALDAPDNVARLASVTASSHFPDCPPQGAVNGVVGGLDLTDFGDEWSAIDQHAGAWLRLAWDTPQTVDRVWLFDRPSSRVQVTQAELRFSDGTTVLTDKLPDDARKGLQIDFAPRTITSLEIRIKETRTPHPFIGLSEIAVFRTSSRE